MSRRWLLLLLLSAAYAQPTPSPAAGEAPSLKVVVTPNARPAVVLTSEADAQLQAEKLAQAAKLRREANKLYSQGRYRDAIGKYDASLALHRDIGVYYSIGVSHQQLEDWSKCIQWMDKFLEKSSDEAKRGRANNARKNCKSRIEVDQTLLVKSTPSGAQVYLDDHRAGVVGTTPYETKITAGPHKIWVEKDGFDPFYRNVVISRKEPFNLDIKLDKTTASGFIYIDCNVKGASIFVQGKNIGITPLIHPIKYPEGQYQASVRKDNYSSFNRMINVKKGQIEVINVNIMPMETPSTWRSSVGWTFLVTSLILGSAGAATSVVLANQEYNDSDRFKEYALYEKLSYWIGGSVSTISLALIIWDAGRVYVPEEDINPNYGKPVKLPESSSRFNVSPLGFGFTF